MLIIMKQGHTEVHVAKVISKIQSMGFKAHLLPGHSCVAIGITGNEKRLNQDDFVGLDGVDEAIPVSKPYKLAGREFKKEATSINVGGVEIKPGRFI